MSTKKGFTLIELLVVIAIIGILSSVVLASLNSARQKSRDARRVSDIKQLQLALELYFDASGTYPLALSDLSSMYIATVPVPPTGSGQTAYAYAALGSGNNCTSYHIGAELEDSGHTALTGDIDADPASECTGNTDFHGNADDCTGDTAGTTELCYDVKP